MKKRWIYEWCRVCKHAPCLSEADENCCASCEIEDYQIPTKYTPLDVIKEFIVLSGGENE